MVMVEVKAKAKTVSDKVMIRSLVVLAEKGRLCHHVELEAREAKRSEIRVQQAPRPWSCYPPEARPGENLLKRYHHTDFQVTGLVQYDEHLHLTIRMSGYPKVRPIECLVR